MTTMLAMTTMADADCDDDVCDDGDDGDVDDRDDVDDAAHVMVMTLMM